MLLAVVLSVPLLSLRPTLCLADLWRFQAIQCLFRFTPKLAVH